MFLQSVVKECEELAERGSCRVIVWESEERAEQLFGRARVLQSSCLEERHLAE